MGATRDKLRKLLPTCSMLLDWWRIWRSVWVLVSNRKIFLCCNNFQLYLSPTLPWPCIDLVPMTWKELLFNDSMSLLHIIRSNFVLDHTNLKTSNRKLPELFQTETFDEFLIAFKEINNKVTGVSKVILISLLQKWS